MTIEDKILEQGILEVVHPNMADLIDTNPTLFAMTRRSGLGASDASVYLGVNKWNTVQQLIEEKRSIGLTEHELDVGNKEVVRKGRDLEPIILKKFADKMGIEVFKPNPMYRIKEHPHLTINFDGVIDLSGTLVPVEAKFCSTFADKYWDKTKQINSLVEGTAKICGYDIIQHIEEEAKLYGIPPYYYTQVQQQMLGLDAPFGYFAVVFDKGWQDAAFKIFKDKYVQDAIISEGFKVFQKIKGTD